MTSLNHDLSLEPKIKQHTHILTYLNKYYEYRKSTDIKFSHEIWSAELGFKSRTFMYLICSGRRPLTIQFIDRLSDYFHLNENEKNHLVLLASHHKTKSADLKAIFYDKILESLDNNETTLNARDYFSFVSSSTMPLIKVILDYDDIKGTESEISSMLNLDIRKVRKDLVALEQMNLITKTYLETSEEAIWKATTKAFKVPNDRSNEIMDHFHYQTMIEASEVTKDKDIFKRFRSIIFAINPDDHEILVTEMENFLSKLKNKFGNTQLKNKHLVKLNLQAYPKSKPLKT